MITEQMLQDALPLLDAFNDRVAAAAQELSPDNRLGQLLAWRVASKQVLDNLQGLDVLELQPILDVYDLFHLLRDDVDEALDTYYANQLRGPTGDQDLDTYLNSILAPTVDETLANNLNELAKIAIETGATHVYLIHQPAGVSLIADNKTLSQHNEPTILLALFTDRAQLEPGIQVLPLDKHDVLGRPKEDDGK